jgi:hypothetical protein
MESGVNSVRLNVGPLIAQRQAQRQRLEEERVNLVDRALSIVMQVLGVKIGPRRGYTRWAALRRMEDRIHEHLRGYGRIERLRQMNLSMFLNDVPGHTTLEEKDAIEDKIWALEDALMAANSRNRAVATQVRALSRVCFALARSRSAWLQTYRASL